MMTKRRCALLAWIVMGMAVLACGSFLSGCLMVRGMSVGDWGYGTDTGAPLQWGVGSNSNDDDSASVYLPPDDDDNSGSSGGDNSDDSSSGDDSSSDSSDSGDADAVGDDDDGASTAGVT